MQKPFGQMSADVSDADSHVFVKAKMSMCLDNISSEGSRFMMERSKICSSKSHVLKWFWFRIY